MSFLWNMVNCCIFCTLLHHQCTTGGGGGHPLQVGYGRSNFFEKNQSNVLQILAFCGVLLSLIKITKFTLDFKVSHRYNNPRTERWQSGNAADC